MQSFKSSSANSNGVNLVEFGKVRSTNFHPKVLLYKREHENGYTLNVENGDLSLLKGPGQHW